MFQTTNQYFIVSIFFRYDSKFITMFPTSKWPYLIREITYLMAWWVLGFIYFTQNWTSNELKITRNGCSTKTRYPLNHWRIWIIHHFPNINHNPGNYGCWEKYWEKTWEKKPSSNHFPSRIRHPPIPRVTTKADAATDCPTFADGMKCRSRSKENSSVSRITASENFCGARRALFWIIEI